MNPAPDITIVLCTFDRADSLRDALQSLSRLSLPGSLSAEILVVDNASTDDTPHVIEQCARQSAIPVRSVRETTQGVVFARNRGIAEARGEWIAFFDDDQLADTNWLHELHTAAREHNVKCVGGSVWLTLPENCHRRLSPVCRMLLGETVGRNIPQPYTARFTPGTGNLMIHRSVFERIGTFNPEFHSRGEDTDLFLRALAAGVTGWYTPAAVVHHLIPPERLTDDFLLQLARLMAEGMAEDERNATGSWVYPFVWGARLLQYAGVLWPRRLWAAFGGDDEARLGAECRLCIAKKSLIDGWQLLLGAEGTGRHAVGGTLLQRPVG